LSPPFGEPPPESTVKRRNQFVAWACDVVSGLRGTYAFLEPEFDKAAKAAEQSVRP
jgi:hypothetical protein